MPRPFTPPDDIKSKERTVLRQLNGMSLADARYVLDVAQSTLIQEVDSTLAREVFCALELATQKEVSHA